jgi:hypothetical protein
MSFLNAVSVIIVSVLALIVLVTALDKRADATIWVFFMGLVIAVCVVFLIVEPGGGYLR